MMTPHWLPNLARLDFYGERCNSTVCQKVAIATCPRVNSPETKPMRLYNAICSEITGCCTSVLSGRSAKTHGTTVDFDLCELSDTVAAHLCTPVT